MIFLTDVLISAMQQLTDQLISYLPRIIVAIIIWWLGKYLLNLAVGLIKKIDIRGTKIDNKTIKFLSNIIIPLGKFILVLIILDFLGIGRTVIGSFMNSLTLAIAIALGIAFGQALQEDAKQLVAEIRKYLKK